MPQVLIWSGDEWATEFTRQRVHFPTLDDDGTDQTAALQAQISDVPDGEEGLPQTVYLPEGNFRIDGRIELIGRSNLVIDGSIGYEQWTDLTGIEAGVSSGGISTRSHWFISASSDLRITGLRITGSNDGRDPSDTRFALWQEALYQEAAISIQGASQRVLVDDCWVTNVHGDAIYVGGTGDPNIDITVRNIIATYLGRQGIAVVNGTNVLFEDCDVQWGGNSGFDVEPNHDSHFVDGITLRRVTMGCKHFPFIFGGDAGTVDEIHVKDVLVEDCVGVNSVSSHMAILGSPNTGENITIRRHTDMRQRSVEAISLGRWAGEIIIEDCVISSGPSTPTSYGVVFNACTAAVTLTGNTFNGATSNAGADDLYGVNPSTGTGAEPSSITHCGNVWNFSTENDGACA
jgi:hypothetical protein